MIANLPSSHGARGVSGVTDGGLPSGRIELRSRNADWGAAMVWLDVRLGTIWIKGASWYQQVQAEGAREVPSTLAGSAGAPEVAVPNGRLRTERRGVR